ncbi:translational GTPase TypA [Candidatus Bodocaedibacter vickermanii]|uniref:Large ribosomal subunit assembly factor BipA n=1 Tax=Candidatus Bodocaedibacter vickermanii TaxID=2741701 RepID=A0A7L9RT29_9PROT|nr:GTP-binding protein TypA/BipA [Candidatus Paracaedibacteraceae bacterium 'Lake Konstanz']
MQDIRNIAIIAHVDHGKTTLVDALLGQSGQFRENEKVTERAMDSNDLEKERGITILAKCTSIDWEGHRINIVDTPGHADFGGEVERILGMVDGAIVLVDAAEGPLPQTKFVLSKALKLGLKPIVVINKIDRHDARADEVLDEVFDLFLALDATPEQLDFPILYASGRSGWADEELEGARKDLTPMFKSIVNRVPVAQGNKDESFQMVVTILEHDPYVGRLLTGRIHSGVAKLNMPIKALNLEGQLVEAGRISKIFAFRGLKRVPVEEVGAGDICIIAGMAESTVTHTLCHPEIETPLKAQPIDPPTLSMTFSVNNSPLAGQEGSKVTSRVIGDRLMKEGQGNIALRITQSEDKDSFEVAGRGELQLGVLIETMRREGFELSISRPRVVYRTDDNGQRLEPIEEVVVDVDEEFSGTVVEKVSIRKGEMVDMRPSGGGKVRIIFHVPSRGLIGYHSEFLTDTRGTGMMNRLFKGYEPFKGSVEGRRNGVLMSNGLGEAVAYALFGLDDRGQMFIHPGDKVYEGMIVGEHNRDNDLDVNVLKGKQLTNVRAAGKDEMIKLTPPRKMTLEDAMAYIQDDELLEVTPKSIRLRKLHLDPNERKRAGRQKEG